MPDQGWSRNVGHVSTEFIIVPSNSHRARWNEEYKTTPTTLNIMSLTDADCVTFEEPLLLLTVSILSKNAAK